MKFIGLTDEQVIKSRNENGSNALSKKEVESLLSKLIEGFKDKMIVILLVALAINVVFVIMGEAAWYEAVGIAVAVVVANFVSVYSEYKNEGKFQSLQEKASRTKCKVYRNGALHEIFVDEVVVGDNIVLQSGDKIPTDGIILSGSIKVDQSTLNGETLEATKLELGNNDMGSIKDLLNKFYLYRGTVVCNGECVMEAKAVGDYTMYGALAKEMQDDTRESPLKLKLGALADKIAVFGYVGGIVIALTFMFQTICIDTGFDVTQMLAYVTNIPAMLSLIVDAIILAVIIIVMAVPEGLPMMIALVLAMNMGKMLEDEVLVRKLNGIETSGGVKIIFSDKTGTITEGKLSVTEIVGGDAAPVTVSDHAVNPLTTSILLGIGINNSASISGQEVIGGNSTDRALLQFVLKSNMQKSIDKSDVIQIQSFDSAKKFSSITLNNNGNPKKYIKGAPEKILAACSTYLRGDGSKASLDISKLQEYMDVQSNKSMRLIAVAVTDNCESEELADNMTLVCLISIRDNVRQEAVQAIKEVKQAGIQVVMVTGDRRETAVAIAKEAKIIENETDVVLTSEELSNKSDDEVKDLLPSLRVVARALPMDKSRLVKLAQELDLVVGMTGDGVNDAPALKKADVGFAMGSGTDVAKEAGDIVILDDNFLSIKQAILYGRTIFKSIRKFIIFQLTVNVAAVLVSFAGPLIGVHEPLTIIQILWINLIMDTLAALAFGGEPPLERYMEEKPIDRKESIVSKQMGQSILYVGILIFIGTLALATSKPVQALVGLTDQIHVYTVMFTFFIFAIIFNAFNARTETATLFEHITENKKFLGVMGLIAIIQIIMVYIGGEVLRTTRLEISTLLLTIALSFLVIPLDVIRKMIFNKK